MKKEQNKKIYAEKSIFFLFTLQDDFLGWGNSLCFVIYSTLVSCQEYQLTQICRSTYLKSPSRNRSILNHSSSVTESMARLVRYCSMLSNSFWSKHFITSRHSWPPSNNFHHYPTHMTYVGC